MPTPPRPLAGGLEGVIVGETRLSRVDGQAGRLTLAGYPVETLAPAVPFESALFLLWHDRLPSTAERQTLAAALAAARHLSAEVVRALHAAADRGASPMNALRLGVATQGLDEPNATEVVGAMPAMLATYACRRRGAPPPTPHDADGHAASLLSMLRGEPATQQEADALSTYLVTVCDHGMNASTFTARVVASTGSELSASIEAALGALQGPLHGGAPGPALDALEALRAQASRNSLDARTRTWVRREVAAGRRIMGFGHRVYRVRDPRADVLGAAADRLLCDAPLLADARIHEAAVLETLRDLKPDRAIATNVEFYTALLLHGLGLSTDLFTPVFAVGRVAGWTAHIAEQVRASRLIRPSVRYVGAEARELAATP